MEVRLEDIHRRVLRLREVDILACQVEGEVRWVFGQEEEGRMVWRRVGDELWV